MTSAAVAAAAAAAIRAIRASGVIVSVEPAEFSKVLAIPDEPLVVYSPPRGMFSKRHQYLVGCRGLAFYTTSPEPIDLGGAMTVVAKSIWIPHG